MKFKLVTPNPEVLEFCMSVAVLSLIGLSGCVSGAAHSNDLGSARDSAMTVGLVQKEVRKGQSQAEVVSALGSPNILTRDKNDNETWVYDKIATEASYSNSSANIGFAGGGLGAAGPALLLGGINGNYSRSAGATSSTQRTLTVIIKFDKTGLVDSFSYHSSKF